MPVDPEGERQSESSSRLLRDDTRFAMARIAVFQYVAVGVFLFLIAGFWKLQVRDYEANSELAERNRIQTVPLPAPRGKILDRDGRIIVNNQPSFSVVLTQENLNKDHLPAIAEGLHLDLAELQAKVKRAESRRKFDPIRLKSDLTLGELAFVESHRDLQTFPELELTQTARRLYPQTGFAAHVIGYVGEVNEQELNSPEFANQGARRHRRKVRAGAPVQRHSHGRRRACSGGWSIAPAVSARFWMTSSPRPATICKPPSISICKAWRKSPWRAAKAR